MPANLTELKCKKDQAKKNPKCKLCITYPIEENKGNLRSTRKHWKG